MPVLGRACDGCGEPLATLKSGIDCAGCGAQFHKKCLMKKGRCNACGADLRVAADTLAKGREIEVQRSRARGQALLFVATILTVGPSILSILLAMDDEAPNALTSAAIRAGVAVALMAAVHRGNEGVAKGVVALLGIGGIGAAGMGALLVGEDGSEALIVTGVLLTISAGMLAFSSDFWAYLHHLRGGG